MGEHNIKSKNENDSVLLRTNGKFLVIVLIAEEKVIVAQDAKEQKIEFVQKYILLF